MGEHVQQNEAAQYKQSICWDQVTTLTLLAALLDAVAHHRQLADIFLRSRR